jgi:hypothetical protein
MAKAKWQKSSLKLAKNHVWKAAPGFKIVVVDRGAARVDIPGDWIVEMGESGLEARNRPQPDDSALIQITVLPMPAEVDWRAMPLLPLFENAMEHGATETLSRGLVQQISRPGLEGVWRETRYFDPDEHKEAVSFCILAREGGIHIFITLSFWPEEIETCRQVWDEVLRSLRLGEYVDASTGRRVKPREN